MKLFELPPMEENRLIIEKSRQNAAVDMPRMHSHPYYEIYFLISGARRFIIGHRIFDVNPGEMLLVPHNVYHQSLALGSSGYERFVIYFYKKYLDNFIALAGQEYFDCFFEKGCIQFTPEMTNHIRMCLEKLESEQIRNDSFSQAAKKNLLEQILLTGFRHGAEKETAHKNGLYQIQHAAEYICENYALPITLHDAASFIYMNDSYFSRKFKAFIGVGFQEYLTQIRIKAAQSMLVSSDLTISEISAECGFLSSNYFGDVFKKWAGMSPTAYRKNFRRLSNPAEFT